METLVSPILKLLFNEFSIIVTCIAGIAVFINYMEEEDFPLSILILLIFTVGIIQTMFPQKPEQEWLVSVIGAVIFTFSMFFYAFLGNLAIYRSSLTANEQIISWHVTCVHICFIIITAEVLNESTPALVMHALHLGLMFILPPISVYVLCRSRISPFRP